MICKCGHTHYESWANPYRNTFSYRLCFARVIEDNKEHYCHCIQFVLDNLKYLEQKYEESLT